MGLVLLVLTLGLAAAGLGGFLAGARLGGRPFARDCYSVVLIHVGGLAALAAVGMAALWLPWPPIVRPVVIAVALVGGAFIVAMTPALVVFFIREALKHRRSNRYYDFVHCPTCGYNLTGNVSGICPECGAAVPERIRDFLARQQVIGAT